MKLGLVLVAGAIGLHLAGLTVSVLTLLAGIAYVTGFLLVLTAALRSPDTRQRVTGSATALAVLLLPRVITWLR